MAGKFLVRTGILFEKEEDASALYFLIQQNMNKAVNNALPGGVTEHSYIMVEEHSHGGDSNAPCKVVYSHVLET